MFSDLAFIKKLGGIAGLNLSFQPKAITCQSYPLFILLVWNSAPGKNVKFLIFKSGTVIG